MSRTQRKWKIPARSYDAKGVFTCEFCGKASETRPYGPNGENVCFECMKQDEESTLQQYYKRLEGES